MDLIITDFFSSVIDCVEGDARIVQYNNINSFRGRIEVCKGGLWGTMTDDGFDSRDAKVVCRQLGYSDLREFSIEKEIYVHARTW